MLTSYIHMYLHDLCTLQHILIIAIYVAIQISKCIHILLNVRIATNTHISYGCLVLSNYSYFMIQSL